ncbi:MAG TPA: hypothetical protein VM012_10170 [Flavitalea sp.]|nr:hypothetical protein [Flavitalea sp.]
MTFEQFRLSLTNRIPPKFDSPHLLAMWYDAQKEWNAAHQAIQDVSDARAAQIHAYLHRKEGDTFNASYWYRKAGTTMPEVGLDQEWEQLVRLFCD